MERILRSEEMAEIILLPVRHHSPACSFHLQKMIEELKPDVICIEGPDNANSLIPMMVHDDTKAPFAIYYSYDDTTGKISEEKEKYKCYYPFLDYSPELMALKAGASLGIRTEFIDLPYGDILAACAEGKGLRREEEKNNYNDDYLLSQNTYLRQLCEKTGLRNFDEFWEKYFELNGLYEESHTWFSNLLTYCTLARLNTPVEQLAEEGCIAREAYMAEKIKQCLKECLDKRRSGIDSDVKDGATEKCNTHESVTQGAVCKVLVVTGGFHTPGLKELLTQEESKSKGRKKVSGKSSGKLSGKVPMKDQGVYLMPYSMEAADALNGYASGMPFPGFYQNVWESLSKMEEICSYNKNVLDYIVRVGKETRKKEGNISTYDEICAFSMAEGLAGLRGKKEPGAYELIDAVLSSFVKGEYNLATDTPMRILRKQMTGKDVGALCNNADVPPIVQDFQAQCKKYGLKTSSTLETEVTLSIFSSKKHRQESMFFNRLNFLKTDFARKVKGPNLQLKKDKNLLREIWKYKWSAQVTSALIDASVYGATIEEAAGSIVKSTLKKEMTAKDSALLLTRVFEMGLKEQLQPVYERVHELIIRDNDFYSLADAVKTLMMMEELCGLYDSSLEFSALIGTGCRRLITLLPSMSRIKDEDLNSSMNALKLLYQITGRSDSLVYSERESFLEALLKMQEDLQIHAGLDGCIYGILYGVGLKNVENVEHACRGYLTGTREQLLKTAVFFQGLFYTARDLVFIGEQFTKMLDEFFGQVTEEEFMEVLAELRMAFAYFTPREIDRIAEKAAGLHKMQGSDILERSEILPDWYSYGKEMDTYVKNQLEEMMYGG